MCLRSCGGYTSTHRLWFCVCACASWLVIGTHLAEAGCAFETSGGARQRRGWRQGEKQGGRRGCRQAPGQLCSSGRPSGTGVPRRTRWNRMENGERRPWWRPLAGTQHAQMLPRARTHTSTHTLAQHPPDPNKWEQPPQAKTSGQNASHMLTSIGALGGAPRRPPPALSAVLVSARGSWQQTAEERWGGRRGSWVLQLHAPSQTSSPPPHPTVICSFNPSLIPHSAALTPRRLHRHLPRNSPRRP